MKNKFYLIALVLLCFAWGATSCGNSANDPTPTPGPSSVSVDKSDISLALTGTTPVTITVPEGATWVVNNKSLWFTATPNSGTGSGTINFQFTDGGYRELLTSAVSVSISAVTSSGTQATTVKVTLPALNNTAPNPTTAATYPENNATNVARGFRFAWKEATDPENDKLTYILEYSTDQQSWTAINETSGIKSTGYADENALFQANTKYYWRVTSWDMFGLKSAPSETFTFTTGDAAAGTWTDGEARLYQNNTNGSTDAFTLIVTGDGFMDADMVPGGDWDKLSARAIEGLFNYVEPYKTYRSYLKIWRVAAVSNERGASEKPGGTETACNVLKDTRFGTMRDNVSSSAWCGLNDKAYSGQTGKTLDDVWNFIEENVPTYKADPSKMQNCAVLVLMNTPYYNGLVNYYSASKRTIGFVCISPGSVGSQQGFENVVVHEIGGHAIGHLADEYISASGTLSDAKKTQTIQYQALGWYQNVDVTGSESTCPWSFFFTAPEYAPYYSAVGLIEGARSVAKGIWRAEQTSCMQYNNFYFNGPSRYAIVKQLKTAAGETMVWKDFVNKDYDRTANTGTRAPQVVPYDFVPLPEPVIINK